MAFEKSVSWFSFSSTQKLEHNVPCTKFAQLLLILTGEKSDKIATKVWWREGSAQQPTNRMESGSELNRVESRVLLYHRISYTVFLLMRMGISWHLKWNSKSSFI